MFLKGIPFITLATQRSIIQETIKFYNEILGFNVVNKISDDNLFSENLSESNSILIHHFESNVTLRILEAQDSILNELYFYSDSIESLEGSLKKANVHVEKSEKKNFLSLKFKDPIGNSINISNFSDPFTSQPIKQKEEERVTQEIKKPSNGKKIGVLTSGGDCAGMNAAYRAVVRTGIFMGCEVYAIHEGYQGLVEGGDLIRQCKWNDVSGIIARGGTVIGTARCKEMRTREGRLQGALNLVSRGIDSLIVIGGDGSLTGANLFRQEWSSLLEELVKSNKISSQVAEEHKHFSVVGMVGSIDNDMWGTDLTIGADSSLHRIVEAIDSLSSTADSHQRAFVIEVMGRNCGWLALMASLATGADWLLIPESPCVHEKDDWETVMCRKLADHKKSGKRSIKVLVAEGALDCKGKPIKADYVRDVIAERIKLETRVTVLGHVQRGGITSAFDRYLGTAQGVESVHAVLEMTPESPSLMIGIDENKISRKPLMECVRKTQAVGEAIQQLNFKEAMNLRGHEFIEAFKAFISSSNCINQKKVIQKPLRIGIIHVGAPAGGMNIATKVAVRTGIDSGHTILGIYGGFEGLIHGEVKELNWTSVEHWADEAGSNLKTNRIQPSANYGLVAYNLQKYQIQALFVIGGFEGFASVIQLVENRKKYPQFCIPIIHLPATISNNVPGTEHSLGSDTALNVIVESCDRIKQSASSSSKRLFVVEVMGGKTGYLAIMAGLGAGASRVYIPEEGIRLADLANDVKTLSKKFATNKYEGRIILHNEEASETYTSSFVSSLFDEEGKSLKLFDCRTVNLGHLQQGGAPSPLDRVRGVSLASKCLVWLIEKTYSSMSKESELNGLPVYAPGDDSACLIGIKGGKQEITPITELIKETDMKNRKAKNQWWLHLISQLKQLSDPSSEH